MVSLLSDRTVTKTVAFLSTWHKPETFGRKDQLWSAPLSWRQVWLVFWLLIWKGPVYAWWRQPWTVVLGCNRKQTEKPVSCKSLSRAFVPVHASRVFPCWSSCPDFLKHQLLSGNVDKTNSFFSRLLFVTAFYPSDRNHLRHVCVWLFSNLLFVIVFYPSNRNHLRHVCVTVYKSVENYSTIVIWC